MNKTVKKCDIKTYKDDVLIDTNHTKNITIKGKGKRKDSKKDKGKGKEVSSTKLKDKNKKKCKFCGEMKTNMNRHIELMHKDKVKK